MHKWGDNGVDWSGISDAAHEIAEYLTKYGRISVQDAKEKFGTVRVYCDFGYFSVRTILTPRSGYWSSNPTLDAIDRVVMPLISRMNPMIVKYHEFIYRRAYKKAILKYPHLIGEIMSGADYYSLLEGLFPQWDRWVEDSTKK